MILNIETSSSICSVALSEGEKIIAEKHTYEANSHSKLLAKFIDNLLKEQQIRVKDLEAIAVSEGPGSYTGLRIGVSTAKGLCYASGLPLIAIDTLQIMCINLIENYKQKIDSQSILCPMLDARRMEVYTAFFDFDANKISETGNMIIDKFSFQTPLQYKKIIFFGDGANKCKNIITHSNAIFVDDIYPIATSMAKLSNQKSKEKQYVDVAYFEPFYLKPFIATKPKNKLQ